jgi:hypothetical protein
MKLRLAVFSAIVLATGFSAIPGQAKQNYIIQGKLIDAETFRWLQHDCELRRRTFDMKTLCEQVERQASPRKVRLPPPDTRRIPEREDDSVLLLKRLQYQDTAQPEDNSGNRPTPRPTPQRPNWSDSSIN